MRKLIVKGRYLSFDDGEPFFYFGDTAWELFHVLNKDEAKHYFTERSRQGFNVAQAVALAEQGGLTVENAYGRLPLHFTDGTPDPTKPDTDGEYSYWDHVETIVLLGRKDIHERIKFDVNVEDLHGRASATATYPEIKAYVLEKFGLKVSSLYIAQIKEKCGLDKRENFNIGEGKSRPLICPPEKEQAIMDAFRHFGMIDT